MHKLLLVINILKSIFVNYRKNKNKLYKTESTKTFIIFYNDELLKLEETIRVIQVQKLTNI